MQKFMLFIYSIFVPKWFLKINKKQKRTVKLYNKSVDKITQECDLLHILKQLNKVYHFIKNFWKLGQNSKFDQVTSQTIEITDSSQSEIETRDKDYLYFLKDRYQTDSNL